MNKIPRIYQDLAKFLKPNKVLVIFGPRQVGKTTLLTDFLNTTSLKYKLDSGDNIYTREIFGSDNFDKIKEYAEGYELIVIDEAQRIPNIGQGLKIMVDTIPNIRIIVTGSSSFELAGQIGEPLTGRKITLTLYTISQIELRKLHTPHELRLKLNESLVYGGYPEIVTAKTSQEKIRLLEELVHSYLLKDILELERIKSSKIVLDLLRLVAFQIGQEVSLTELAQQLGLDYKTVGRYLDLFEKSFILYAVHGFSRNLRKEVTKKNKYYFYDNGIRNALISNFNSIEMRNDLGVLWENFLFIERIKKRSYHQIYANYYFWRTWDQKEIDLIEEREGKLFGFEFKLDERRAREPKDWKKTYKEAEYTVISQKNYLDFIL